MTTMMSHSPHLGPGSHLHSHPHSRGHSPIGSPLLRASTPSNQSGNQYASSSSGNTAPPTPLGPLPGPALSPRSYARQPTQRPYASPRDGRGGRVLRDNARLEGDPLRFAELVVDQVHRRGQAARKGSAGQTVPLGLGLMTAAPAPVPVESSLEGNGRKTKSLANSLAGSWEQERAELIVDIPVWSPGCFTDLSTLHALRDRTLAHTHALLAHLMGTNGIPSSYRLLARSAITSNRHRNSGWGCIRLAPGSLSPRSELKPKVRRSSMDLDGRMEEERELARAGVGILNDRPQRAALTRALQGLSMITSSPNIRDVSPAGSTRSIGSIRSEHLEGLGKKLEKGQMTPELWLEDAIADDDDFADRDGDVKLKSGYKSGSVSDDEEEEEADELVAREAERRGAKEGTVFLMNLFGGPALILV